MTIWLFRLALSAAVLGALTLLVPVGQVVDAMSRIDVRLWAAVMPAFLALHAIAAVKWRLLMGTAVSVRPLVWLRAHFAGLVANLCLPSIVGGDVVRAAAVMRRANEPERVAVASLADRGIDTAALLAIAAAGIVLAGPLAEQTQGTFFAVSVVLLIGFAGAGAGYAVLRRVRARPMPGRLVSAIELLVRRPGTLFGCVVLSLGVQLGLLGLNAAIGSAVGVPAHAAGWLTAWPLSKLVALVPVSLGGLGVREAALVALMKPFGGAAADVLAAGLLWQGVLIASGLVGWMTLHFTSPPHDANCASRGPLPEQDAP
jgi:uncharacterized membrane protein YbhN (UPF0104 family)